MPSNYKLSNVNWFYEELQPQVLVPFEGEVLATLFKFWFHASYVILYFCINTSRHIEGTEKVFNWPLNIENSVFKYHLFTNVCLGPLTESSKDLTD